MADRQRISSTLVLRAYVIYACAIGALVLMGNLWLAAGAALLWGIAGQIRSTGTIALLQTSIPDEQRGRVMGTEFLFSRIAGGIGTYLVGTAAEQHGLQVPMLIAVGVCLAGVGLRVHATARDPVQLPGSARRTMIKNETAP